VSRKKDSTLTALKILEQMCARNNPIEVHYEDPSTRSLSVGRARLIEVRDDGLITDQLQYAEGNDSIPVERPVTAHFSMEGNQYAFETSITDASTKVAINETQKVRGMTWKRPEAVKSVQRRDNFRVSVAAMNIDNLGVARVADGAHPACPVDGYLGKARLCDVSSGGLGMLCGRDVVSRVEIGEKFFVSIDFPGLEGETCMLVTVRHVDRIEKLESFKLGCSFEPWSGQDLRRAQQQLTKSITQLERKALRRNR
jgi:c-di-GMP-binding flagellar brake protein YcgR